MFISVYVIIIVLATPNAMCHTHTLLKCAYYVGPCCPFCLLDSFAVTIHGNWSLTGKLKTDSSWSVPSIDQLLYNATHLPQ